MSSDIEAIRHALTIARNRGFAEVVLESGDLKFKASLEPRGKSKSAPTASVPSETPETESTLVPITSSTVGYFRLGDSPVSQGDSVTAGQVVGVVASLGDIPYGVEAPSAGTIANILVEAGAPVMYGQVLMEIEP